jgi:hypothetical protein
MDIRTDRWRKQLIPAVTSTSKPLGLAQDQDSDQESIKCFHGHGHIEGSGNPPKPVCLPSMNVYTPTIDLDASILSTPRHRNAPIGQIFKLDQHEMGRYRGTERSFS